MVCYSIVVLFYIKIIIFVAATSSAFPHYSINSHMSLRIGLSERVVLFRIELIIVRLGYLECVYILMLCNLCIPLNSSAF